MYNVIQLIAKYGAHILFVVLEIICFTLIIKYNRTQKDIFINSSNIFAGKVSDVQYQVAQFTKLKNQNDSLMRENANLIENLIAIDYSSSVIPPSDSILNQYSLIPVHITNSSIHKRNNYFTLGKGSREGIRSDMGVIASHKGIVGIIRNVSENLSQAISLLHSQTNISCSIKSRKGHGTLVWKNMDPLRMNLDDIPKHEKIAVGDTVITSGYSTMFPKGILVGTIEKYNVVAGSNSYNITVKLFNDLTNIQYAYVVQNRFANEQTNLEKEVVNE